MLGLERGLGQAFFSSSRDRDGGQGDAMVGVISQYAERTLRRRSPDPTAEGGTA